MLNGFRNWLINLLGGQEINKQPISVEERRHLAKLDLYRATAGLTTATALDLVYEYLIEQFARHPNLKMENLTLQGRTAVMSQLMEEMTTQDFSFLCLSAVQAALKKSLE